MKKTVLLLSIFISVIMTACSDKTVNNDGEKESGNAALECIMTRTSIRAYDAERKIGKDTVEILLKAAMAAPTAVNKQPWAFVVVDDRAVMDSLMAACPYARMLESAPMAIVTCGDLSLAIEGEARDMWIQDVSAATENLLLAAHAVGLGAVWTGVYPIPERLEGVRKALGLPSNIVPLAVVPVGYPAGNATPKDKWMSEKVHYNGWN